MKKIINIKEIMIILLAITIIAVATNVFATDPTGAVFPSENNVTPIGANEYEQAQTIPTDPNSNTNTNTQQNNNTNNTVNTSNTANNVANTNNTARTYNTNKTNTNLPQTGIEDYNIGILLVIGVASAIFAYKKIQDYKNI